MTDHDSKATDMAGEPSKAEKELPMTEEEFKKKKEQLYDEVLALQKKELKILEKERKIALKKVSLYRALASASKEEADIRRAYEAACLKRENEEEKENLDEDDEKKRENEGGMDA